MEEREITRLNDLFFEAGWLFHEFENAPKKKNGFTFV